MRIALWTVLVLALLVPRAEASPLVVVVDAGHGGTNLGARSEASAYEKDITLFVARAISRTLSQVSNVKVVLTRSRDELVTLSERVRRANAAQADVFVSLHCNASPGRNQRGYEVFVLSPDGLRRQEGPTARVRLSEALTDPARALDMEVDAAVASLRRSGLRRKAVELGSTLVSALSAQLGREHNRGVREGRFDVLMGLAMPGVLVELGFLDHPADARFLTSSAQLLRIAGALSGAILRHGAGRVGLTPPAGSVRKGAGSPPPDPWPQRDRRRPTPSAPERAIPPRPAVAFEVTA